MEEKNKNQSNLSTATTRFINNIRTLVTSGRKGKTAYFRRRRQTIIRRECPFISLLREYIVKNLEYEKIYSFFRTDPLIRSKQNIKTIGDFLGMGKNPFFNDLKEKNSRLLYTVTNCLLLEHYEKDQNLFFENTDIEKYYIVLKGKVTLYKRKIKRKEMTLNDFINYLESVYNLEYDIEKQVYKEIQIKNFSLHKDLNWILSDTFELPDDINKTEKRYFLIDENVKYYDIINGEPINEISILTSFKETFSAFATEDSYILYLKKHTFYSILHGYLERELEYYIKDLRKSYILYRNWTSNAIEKVLRISIPEKPYYNDIIFEQKSNSDYIYFVKNGQFKIYIDISIESSHNFKKYIINDKTNLLNWLKKITLKDDEFSQNEIDEYIQLQRKKIGKYPINYLFRTNYDKYIKSKIGQKDNVLDIKMKEEKIANKKYIQRVNIGNVFEGEFFGLEDSIELKQRYYSVKCCSEKGELRKIHINDLLYILANTKTINLDNIYNIIKEKKDLLIEKINRCISVIERKNEIDIDFAYSKALSLEKKIPKVYKRTKLLGMSKFSLIKNTNESIFDTNDKFNFDTLNMNKNNFKKYNIHHSINISKDNPCSSHISLNEKLSSLNKRKQFISLLKNKTNIHFNSSSFNDSEHFNSLNKNTQNNNTIMNVDSFHSISFYIPLQTNSFRNKKIFNLKNYKKSNLNFKNVEKKILTMTGIFKTDRKIKRKIGYNLNLNLISSEKNNFLSRQIIKEHLNNNKINIQPKKTNKKIIHKRVFSASLSQRSKQTYKIKINSPKNLIKDLKFFTP